MSSKRIAAVWIGVALAGCSLSPEYRRPAAPVAGGWTARPGTEGVTNVAAADLDWRSFFEDARLRAILGIAIQNNRDLRIAALRVEQARAQYRIQRAGMFPSLGGDATGIRQKTSGTVSAFDQGTVLSTYDLEGSVAYEVDLFGRVRSLKREAAERYLATEEARRGVHLALVSEVASQYLTLIQYREAKAIGQQTLDAVQASSGLIERSYEAGVASDLDRQTARTQVESARVSIANYAELLAQAENAFVALVGGPLPADLPPAPTLQQEQLLAILPAGLPSEVLRRRPDILAAEHTLMAANADIGAARAAFYPRILLTASGGVASASLGTLFSGPSSMWSFSPQISIPIFDGGATRANLNLSKLNERIEVATYEKAIQTAFREVADALAVRSLIGEKLQAQERLVEAEQRRFDLTTARYRQGVDSYVDVLLAQQSLYSARQILLQFQGARLLNAIALYRSLGGGWKS